MQIEIKRWDTGAVIHAGEFPDLCAAVADAVAKKIDLYHARLDHASLVGASLDGARLDHASLVGASLDRASLDHASLVGASLDHASLDHARLVGASLVGASLDNYRRDLEHVLFCHPHEAAGVLAALREGRVDGSVYAGECACLIGTIANAKHCDVETLERDSSRPAESWFMQFRPGMTPENHSVVKLTCEWIEAWLAQHGPKA